MKATSTRSIADPHERFMAHVDTSGGPDTCHPWTGNRNRKGYGLFFDREARKAKLAHRWLLGHLRGVPLSLDEQANHHCDNPSCCNPAHLYVGTQIQNIRDREERGRGNSGAASAGKTRCVNGHLYDGANTYISPQGWRQCRACRREKSRAFRDRPDRRERARQRTREWREMKARKES